MSFTQFDLPEILIDRIKKLGWDKPTAIQAIAIPKALDGFDILGGAPTGTGKSAAFLLPIVSKLIDDKTSSIKALILEPTRELAMQVAKVGASLCGDDIEISAIIGGEGRDIQRQKDPKIVVATPGRLSEFIKKEWIDVSDVEMLVIDEADRMLDMGFKDDVLKIVNELVNVNQAMLFSATLEGFGVREFADEILEEPIEIKLGAGDNPDERLPEKLSSRAYYAASSVQKVKILIHLLTTANNRSIVFTRTKDRASELFAKLKKVGFKVALLSGDQTQNERQASMRRFSDEDANILVATDVAARGLDLPEIAFVYNFDLPNNAATYVHRAGRTARAGAKGAVASLVEKSELSLLSKIERYTQKDIERRSIKGLCAAFNDSDSLQNVKKTGRASIGGKGGFDKKKQDGDKKVRVKVRWRDKKNKGKPDFAKKRAKKATVLKAKDNVNE